MGGMGFLFNSGGERVLKVRVVVRVKNLQTQLPTHHCTSSSIYA